MSTSLLADAQAFRARLGRLDEALLGGEDCAVLVEELALVGKSCDAARSRLAARAESIGAHRRRGFLDGADWLAGLTGTNTGEARRAMELIGALQACPTTGDAFAAGELSVAQASEIARTEAVRPGSEAELLDTARRAPLRVLRERASTQRLESVDADELARRQHQARRLKHWRDGLGMTRIQAALTPADGVTFLARLDADAERLRRQARRAGEAEPWEAHAADALVGLAVGDGQARGARRRADVVFVCDIGAYRRGRAEEGEAGQARGDERGQ